MSRKIKLFHRNFRPGAGDSDILRGRFFLPSALEKKGGFCYNYTEIIFESDENAMKNNKAALACLLRAALALLLLLPLLASCGAGGLSAYEIALKNGLADGLSESEWIGSLKGRDGADGRSAYELALEAGFGGSLEEWLSSLAGSNGEDGADGRSAYEIAAAGGYSGSESQWVAELLGGRTDPGTGGGVGISSVNVNSARHLIVRLTNGTIIDAGYVGVSDTGNGDAPAGAVDSDGYAVVNQTVTVNTGALNIRSSPDSSVSTNVVADLKQGEELNRIGIGMGENIWSKVMYGGRVCYAASRYLDLKASADVDLRGVEIPKVNLLDSYILEVGRQTCFEVDQFTVGLSPDMYASFRYDGGGAKISRPGSFSVTPSAAETASLTFAIKKYVGGSLVVIYSKTVKLISVNPTSRSLTALIIGDSRISDTTLVDTLKLNFGSRLTLIGTKKTPAGNAHEGRGGWSAANYAVYEKTSASDNPFYNPATKKFDFEYYLTAGGFSAPDFVVFNLGANDNYSALSVSHLKDMAGSVLAYNQKSGKSVRVLIMTEYLAPASGYSLTGDYGNFDAAAKRELQFEYFNLQNAAFGGRASEGIYLIPNYIVIDNDSDRQRANIAASDRSGDTMTLISDAVHLSVSGYKKEADLLGAYINSIFASP